MADGSMTSSTKLRSRRSKACRARGAAIRIRSPTRSSRACAVRSRCHRREMGPGAVVHRPRFEVMMAPLIEVQALIGRLNHVAIAVRDIAAATKVYRETLGAAVSAAVPQFEHGVTTVFVTLPNTKIEL